VAWGLAERAAVAFVGWRLFKSNAYFAVFLAMKGQVIAMPQIV
jgi:hypothetical protein